MTGGGSIEDLLDLFGKRLPTPLGFALAQDGEPPADHPLRGEILAAIAGAPTSLPYVRDTDIMWVTLAPSAELLRRAIDDLRCWILPSYGWEGEPSIVSQGSPGSLGARLLELSPQGYFRWHSRLADADLVIDRLGQMRRVIDHAPARELPFRPSLDMLRRQYTLGLATGDRQAALRAIDEIDQRQLDTASNALSMRIRLDAAFGDHQAIVANDQLENLLSMRLPQRVAEAILVAHHSVYLEELEAAEDYEAAFDTYQAVHDRVAGLLPDVTPASDVALARMAAYDAATEDDAARFVAVEAHFLSDPVIQHLAQLLTDGVAAATEPTTDVETNKDVADLEPDPNGPRVAAEIIPLAEAEHSVPSRPVAWSDIAHLVAAEDYGPLEAFLEGVGQSPDDSDPGDGEILFELFTNSEVAAQPRKRQAAEHVLTSLIDAYVCEDLFPRRDRLPLYQTLLDVWSSNRALSTDLIDGQMLLTMADALLRLDGSLEKAVTQAVGRWWEARPVRSRLPWLGEALELLTEQSAAQDHLSLWYAGAALIKLDHEDLKLTDRHLWQRLGRRLGLEPSVATERLGGEWLLDTVEGDPLAGAGFKKIAIVSLHERSARDAAIQIEARTKADVIVVTDHAAGEGTSSAATADVILFVWGATKHAVYRAFDKVRDRLEYVPGTGSASIVRALERRAGAI